MENAANLRHACKQQTSNDISDRPVNTQTLNFPRFFVSSPTPCPYLDNRLERKIYTDLSGPQSVAMNDALSQAGFRRSQNVAYRPACDGCGGCVSVRVPVSKFEPGKTMRRIRARNADLSARQRLPLATEEQYDLLQRYLKSRHPEGGMAEMGMSDYIEMVESSPVRTFLIEYRESSDSRRDGGRLVAVALTDMMSDGLSMVYSFYDPEMNRRSLGTFVVLHHIDMTTKLDRPYLYLGYWVAGSRKMNYKINFQPLERLGAGGWNLFEGSRRKNEP